MTTPAQTNADHIDADPIDTARAIAEFGDLPTLAPVAVEVLRLADDDRATLDDIGHVISRDPALSSQILRVANSAMYRVGGEVTTLGRATTILGLRTVKLLSLSFSVVTRPDESDATGRRLWRHTLVKSALANALAVSYQPRVADECFIAGLLGNMGKLVLEQQPRYVEARGTAPWIDAAVELEMLGTTSDDVAAQLLEGWGLPALLADSIRHTHDPHEAVGPAGTIAGILQVADAAARFLTAEPDEGPDALAALQQCAATRLGMDSEAVEAFLTEAAGAVHDVASMFSADSLTPMPVSELLARAKSELARLSLDMVAALSVQESRTEQLATENERLATEALTDPLTRLPNRRSFDQTFNAEISRRLRRPDPTSVGLLMMDLDKFKSINDTHGHQAGDDVLRGFAARLSLNTRRDEFAARIGGEEFMVFIPVTDPEEIRLAAERFRRCVADEPFDTCVGPLAVTVSIGVASTTTIDEHTETILYEAADKALYVAKDGGRNRVAVAPVVSSPTP